jgi:hypothetical protein
MNNRQGIYVDGKLVCIDRKLTAAEILLTLQEHLNFDYEAINAEDECVEDINEDEVLPDKLEDLKKALGK